MEFEEKLVDKACGDEVPKRTVVAIPCFNEEATVGSVVLKAKQFVDEVVVVDDGSVDETAKVAELAGAVVIRHGGNKGYGAAIRTCFQYARNGGFDALTILDGDGQHDADEIQTVMKPVLEEQVDVSIGSRFLHDDNGVPRYRRFGIWLLTRFSNVGSAEKHRVSDGQSGFRSYSRRAILQLDPRDPDMGASAEILMQARKHNLLFKEVPISCSYDGDTSTEGPVGHGLGVLVSILKYMEVEHSLLFFGVPGVILFAAGLFFGSTLYFNYMETQIFSMNYALVTIGLLVLGTLCGMTGLILHAVINAGRRR